MLFKGIKYSKVTGIFYTVVNGTLYKLPAYRVQEKKSENGKVLTYEQKIDRLYFIPSDYKDMDGNSSKWEEATKEQYEEYKLHDKIERVLLWNNTTSTN